MKKGDRWFAFICLGLSFWLLMESFQLDYKSGFTPGPGFEPFWLGVALAVLSVFLLIETFTRNYSEKERKPRLPARAGLVRVGAIILILLGFAALMNIVGFPATVFLFVTAVLLLLEGDSFPKSLAYGVLFTGGIYVVFVYWMQLDLPAGFLGL